MKLKPYVFSAMALAATTCFVILIGGDRLLWSQDAQPKAKVGENLQVLEFDNMVDLQNYMKGLTEALGVNCKFCHDLMDFPKDDPKLHKLTARKFMTMVKGLNEGFFKDMDEKVTCFTCHQGRKEPVNSKAELMKIQEEEAKN
ncbi:MAG: photosynthetic reaction center cytochrome c subunit [bacterium]|nr:photosynthetic reaction center cytochrome c subunit [bacterium]